jgi:tRNA-splicing ligase RtcB
MVRIHPPRPISEIVNKKTMIITTEKIPIKIWADDMEEGALEQAKNLANLPFAFKHIAIMPDTHQGFGMPIGGVLATKDVIVPNAVGVDIGCGMCAVKTSLTEIDKETLKKIMGEIRKVIPVGFNKHKEEQDEKLMPQRSMEQTVNMDKYTPIVEKEYSNALKSLGTLGGGNHFIEIQKGSDGYIWIMIHSGSRNLGKQVADYYNKVAIELNKKWFSNTQKELNFLPVDSEEGQAYIREMSYCVEFALANRKLMMDKIKDIFQKTDMTRIGIPRLSIVFEPMINIAHNYARLENHFGENVWVHRKGATLATKNTIGIIPGSQGTKSYIVKGKGNPESFMSCSHGAGRKMGRNEAIKNLNLEEEIKRLDDMGVVHAIRGVKDLDEAPGSYKDIDIVMENQKDLVEILVELTPLAVIKG